MGPLILVVYPVAKFLAYCVWCYVGLRLAGAPASGVATTLRLGATRWFLGLGFGILVFFFVGTIDASDAARMYFLVYTPVRAVEWGIMAFLVARHAPANRRAATVTTLILWCAGGMIVSFLTDLLSPEGMQGRFCVGRCLC